MDSLRAKFMPRFTAVARDRLDTAMEVATNRWRDRANAVAHDLHALAGEAGLLGLEGVIGPARTAEQAAHRFDASGVESDAISLAESLKQLQHAITEATTVRAAGG